jgi:hypothetical protein
MNKLLFTVVMVLFPVLLFQCNFTNVREEKQLCYMYFKANGIERHLYRNLTIGKNLTGNGLQFTDNLSIRFYCSIRIDTLIPKHLWIDSNSAVYEYLKYYYSYGHTSDSIIIDYDPVNQYYYGHFSFIAVSDPLISDTTRDTVRITDGVFIYSSKKDTVE